MLISDFDFREAASRFVERHDVSDFDRLRSAFLRLDGHGWIFDGLAQVLQDPVDFRALGVFASAYGQKDRCADQYMLLHEDKVKSRMFEKQIYCLNLHA